MSIYHIQVGPLTCRNINAAPIYLTNTDAQTNIGALIPDSVYYVPCNLFSFLICRSVFFCLYISVFFWFLEVATQAEQEGVCYMATPAIF